MQLPRRSFAIFAPLLSTAAIQAQVGRPMTTVELSNSRGSLAGQLEPLSSFGEGLAALGDLDGDGVIDLAVGASMDSRVGTSFGALYVLYLNADGSARALHRTDDASGTLCFSLSSSDQFGASLATLGDLDADGFPELAVGIPGRDGGDVDEGAVAILSLSSDGSVRACTLLGEAAGGFSGSLAARDAFGSALANLGDLDGDGLPELAVGSPGDDTAGTNSGAVWILFLRPDGTIRRDSKLTSGVGGFGGVLRAFDEFGSAITTTGDLDGNGVPELLVGVPKSDDAFTDDGAVWEIFLDATGTAVGELELVTGSGGLVGPLDFGAEFGSGLVRIPDLDGDGADDLIVGANAKSSAMTGDAGSYWLLRLGPGGTVLFEEKFEESDMPTAYQRAITQGLGSDMAFLGDMDGDGAPSVAFATPGGSLTTVDGAVWVMELCDADPFPAFSVQGATTGTSPLTVSFLDASTGTGLTSWTWDFGDGRGSTQASPTHTFTKVGTYDVTLTVVGADGMCFVTEEELVVVDSAFAQASSRNGSGGNPDILQSTSLPVLGSTWTARIDASSLGATGIVFLVGYEFPISGFPTPFGELLLDPTPPALVLDVRVFLGGISNHAIPVPNDLALSGCSLTMQALLNASGRLTNAVDLVLGL